MFPLRGGLPMFPETPFPFPLWGHLMFPRLDLPKSPVPPPVTSPPLPVVSVRHGASTDGRQLSLKQVDQDITPSPEESVKGVLLLDIVVGGRRFVSLICIREDGFPEGMEIQIPDSWRVFCREEPSGNVGPSTVTRAIECGEEIVLRPIRPPSPLRKEPIDLTLETKVSSDSLGFSCDRCGKVFSYAYYRDKHLKYTRCVDKGDRKFPCPICSRSFEKRDRLRIHVLHVHENHRPHRCTVCGKAFSQSSSLNKHLRVHSGERPYKCAFCPKAFTASSILRTHIRQHSGEKPFKCAHCGKPFASHAAHDSHVRRTHQQNKE